VNNTLARLVVDRSLGVPAAPEVFVAGDAAVEGTTATALAWPVDREGIAIGREHDSARAPGGLDQTSGSCGYESGCGYGYV
jgi:hypothetical protein